MPSRRCPCAGGWKVYDHSSPTIMFCSLGFGAVYFFHIDLIPNGITFATAGNRLYAVEACGRLGDPSLPSNGWKNICAATQWLPGIGNTFSVPLTTHRFYRAKVRMVD